MAESVNAAAAPAPKIVHRLVPCPLYDIEALESWLGDMAQQGYLLCQDGFWGDLVSFEVGRPRRVRYRLDAAPIRRSIMDEAPHPSEEELEIAAAAGWQYMGRRSYFYVYCTAEPLALELNTDPKVQALSLDILRKELTGNLMLHLTILLIHGWKILGMPLLTMIELGFFMGSLTLIVLLWYILGSLLDMLQVRRLQKKLKQGTPLDHKKDWRKARLPYWGRFTLDLLGIVWVMLLLYASVDDTSFGRQRVPLESYSKPLPFATIADYDPAGEYQIEEIGFGKYNTLTRKSGMLSKDFIDLWEYGRLNTSDGRFLKGYLLVKYYELPNEVLAQEIARELEWMDRSANPFVKHETLALPTDVTADYLTGYLDAFPCVIIRQGCRVAQYEVSLSWRDETGYERFDSLSLEDWVPWAAASLQP